jgi:hypothetical protein
VRSSQPPRPATVFVEQDGEVRVTLAEPENGVAAGQACVLYIDHTAQSRILGGGFVAKAITPALLARGRLATGSPVKGRPTENGHDVRVSDLSAG